MRLSRQAEPYWYKLPMTGKNRTAMEGFAQLGDGAWLMGFGRQNGNFACINMSDGSIRWELPLEASVSDVVTNDVDGDGDPEFVFGTSYGSPYAVGKRGGVPRITWKADLGALVGNPIASDLDGDGRSEIAVTTSDGYANVFDNSRQTATYPAAKAR
jgi:outer membrane protein assembly factor BamB